MLPWQEMLEFHKKADLLRICDIADVKCKKTWTKEKITKVLTWNFANSDLLIDRFLDEETRTAFLYLYELDGRSTEKELSLSALANLMLLGLISIHWPKPEWSKSCVPAIVWMEGIKESLYDRLKKKEAGQMTEEWAGILAGWLEK